MAVYQQHPEMIDHLTRWAEQQADIRAMLLTSTRAIPDATSDILSDYDVILVVEDVIPYFAERDWLAAFGSVLVLYRDPLENYFGHPISSYVVQFAHALKIDFTIWPIEVMQHIAAESKLTDELDAGYRVLLDKDDLTGGLHAPTYKAYIPAPPTEDLYQEYVEAFFLESIYVAKYLWRNEILAAKYVLDVFMKHEHLIPMLEWHMEIQHQWVVKPGLYGQRLRCWLREDLWGELEETYTAAAIDSNWDALYKTITLFSKVSQEVGAALGYPYPQDKECRTLEYVAVIQSMEN